VALALGKNDLCEIVPSMMYVLLEVSGVGVHGIWKVRHILFAEAPAHSSFTTSGVWPFDCQDCGT
jgi:hypothetical protein